MVIPTFWDGKANNTETACRNTVANSLSSACNALDLNVSLSFPNGEIEKFYKYIMKTRGDIITPLSVKRKKGKSVIDIMSIELSDASTKSPIEFYSSKIKYMIENYHPEIKRIILVLDDIETLSEKKQKYLIDLYHHILGCLPNNLAGDYSVNLIISLRPFSYRFLNNDEYWRRESRAYYSTTIEIWKSETASLTDLFFMRFDKAVKKTPDHKSKESWKTSYDALKAIITKMNASGRISEMLLKLNLSNLRGVMDSLKIILCNRAWFQRNELVSEHPHVEQGSYGCDNIVTIIRSLACGENHFFNDNIDDVPYFYFTNGINLYSGLRFFYNILRNAAGKCDIFALYIIKYLYERKIDFYNDSSLKVKLLKKQFDQVFLSRNSLEKNTYNASFDYAVKTLFGSRAIRKSIIDHDSEKTLGLITYNNIIYLSQRGEIYWNMISSDSMLLELFREDMLREYSNDEYYMGSIEYRTFDKVQILFEDLLRLIHEIIDCEEQYVLLASNQANGVKKYDEFFGLFEISYMFLFGVKESIRRSKYNDNNALQERVVDCENRIRNLKEHYTSR